MVRRLSKENGKVVFAEIDKGALASSNIAALDAALFPQKSPFPTTVPSFNHFQPNAHTCPLRCRPGEPMFKRTRTREPWQRRGETQPRRRPPRRPPCSPVAQRSPALPPPRAAQPLAAPHSRGPAVRGSPPPSKMVVLEPRRRLPHTAPPSLHTHTAQL